VSLKWRFRRERVRLVQITFSTATPQKVLVLECCPNRHPEQRLGLDECHDWSARDAAEQFANPFDPTRDWDHSAEIDHGSSLGG
jgi:hypothetical protein